MKQLNAEGKYTITDDMKEKLVDFVGGYASQTDTNARIKDMYEKTGYVLDTHTAVASSVYQDYKTKTNDDTKTVIASTASPFKFTVSVMNALGMANEGMDDYQMVDKLSEVANVKVPNAVEEIKTAPILHDFVCKKDEMVCEVKSFLGI